MWIPPVYSPIRLSGIWKGLRARPSAIPELEKRLTEWYGAERALATASGTHALQLAIRAALDHAETDGPVAMPAFNCFDLASAAVWVGAPVVFYDLDPMTLAPGPGSLARAAEEAGVLVVANLFGYPLDWDLIRKLANDRGIPVVEDAAQGMGAGWNGRPAGTLADLSVLSFGRGKGWTGGSGGAVLARNGFGAALPEALPAPSGSRFREAAGTAAVWLLARPLLYGVPARLPGLGLGETHYRPPTEPRAITPFAAALAMAGRDRSLAEVEVRRRNAAAVRERLEGKPGTVGRNPGNAVRGPVPVGRDPGTIGRKPGPVLVPRPLAGGECGYLRLPVLLPSLTKEGAGASISVDRKKGIYRSYPRALVELEVMEELTGDLGTFPGARRLAGKLVTLPTHSRLGKSARKGAKS